MVDQFVLSSKFFSTMPAVVEATTDGARPSCTNSTVNFKLQLRRVNLPAPLALVLLACCWYAVVPQGVPFTNCFTLARSPFSSTQVAELSSTVASNVIAA